MSDISFQSKKERN